MTATAAREPATPLEQRPLSTDSPSVVRRLGDVFRREPVLLITCSYLFISIYDAARWPSSIFSGIFAFVFTFVIPLALMTTYPALAILGKLPAVQLGGALATALAFLVVSRLVWRKAIRKYTSAGG